MPTTNIRLFIVIVIPPPKLNAIRPGFDAVSGDADFQVVEALEQFARRDSGLGMVRGIGSR